MEDDRAIKIKDASLTKKKLNPLDPAGNTTVCFNCGCKFHWSYDCPYVDSSRDKHGGKNQKDLSVAHIVLMSQQKHKNSGDTLLGETLGSAVLDCGV